ncbi:MAG: hypothetical protein J7647_26665 [Cyanobacteria bacterium SBLK]|nr:hypothetical protein [Cyanobacteria bacterium SBLK]
MQSYTHPLTCPRSLTFNSLAKRWAIVAIVDSFPWLGRRSPQKAIAVSS